MAKLLKSSKSSKRYREIVTTNSRFYDTFLKNDFRASEDYVVFLDSIEPYHGDQLVYGYAPPDRKIYYPQINHVLDFLSYKLGKEVVICLHPKYDDRNLKEDWGTKKAFKFRTDEFIARAALVTFHSTSSVNSAFLYNKKIVQILNKEFNPLTRHNCEVMQKVFGFTTLEMYNTTQKEVEEALQKVKVDGSEYQHFIDNYLIASGQPGVTSAEQVVWKMKEKYLK